MYHYLGDERLQLFFFSPNVCAAFIIMSSMLEIGFFIWLLKKSKLRCKIISWLFLFPTILLQFYLLALTYSRGGYLGAFIALLITFFISRKKISFIFLLIYFIILILNSNGISRLQSISEFSNASIYNRFLIWKGGAGIIANHWLKGVSPDTDVGTLYTNYYQPLELDEEYSTLVSDYMTIGAKYGIVVLFVILSILLFTLQQSIVVYRKSNNPILLYAVGAVLGYMIASSFTTCYRFHNVIWLLGAIVFFLIISIGFNILCIAQSRTVTTDKEDLKLISKTDFWGAESVVATRDRNRNVDRKTFLKILSHIALPTCVCYPLLLSGFFCVTIFLFGTWVNHSLPYCWKNDYIYIPEKVSSFTIQAKNNENNFHLIVINRNIETVLRPILRPFVNAGFKVTVLSFELEVNNILKIKKAIEKIAETAPENSLILLGVNEESSVQILAATNYLKTNKILGTVVINTSCEWLSYELSSRLNITKYNYPLWIFYNEPNLDMDLKLVKISSVNLVKIPASFTSEKLISEFSGKYILKILPKKGDLKSNGRHCNNGNLI